MKKAVKVFGGLLLLLLFCGSVMIYFNTYQKKQGDKEEEKKEVSVKVSQQIFELGEDAKIGDIVFNVAEAELIEDYEKIDDYYKKRKHVLSPKEYINTYIKTSRDLLNYSDIFPDDVRFFRIQCSVTNCGMTEFDFEPQSLSPVSVMNGEMISWNFMAFDARGTTENGEKEIQFTGKGISDSGEVIGQIYTLLPEEKINVEVVGEFHIYDYFRDVNTSIDDTVDSYDLYLMRNFSTKRVHLNIEGCFGNGEDAYAKVRNIQKMKSESWTNLERKEWVESWNKWGGYKFESDTKEIVETKEPGQHFIEYLSSDFSLETILENFRIEEWKNLPDVYNERGNLKQMAQRYQEVYGCKEEELKVLLLDLVYVSSEIKRPQSYFDRVVNYFYGRSKLYTKNEKEELWLFGEADDWIVVSNSKNPEKIGSVNIITMGPKETITVQMAYILPPQFYEKCDALYFTGGRYELLYAGENVPVTKIVLK